MFNLATFGELYRHMEWADALIWQAVLQSEAARGDEKILEKLRHIHRTQQFLLKVWRAEAVDFRKSEDCALLDELALVRRYYVTVLELLEATGEETLSSELRVPWADYFAKRTGRERAAPTTLGETMFQAVAHSNYHRGQLNTRLRELGAEPPLCDYIAWIWLGRPVPVWPEAA
jgi:uncharacterized damage-inducible protein DinB